MPSSENDHKESWQLRKSFGIVHGTHTKVPLDYLQQLTHHISHFIIYSNSTLQTMQSTVQKSDLVTL